MRRAANSAFTVIARADSGTIASEGVADTEVEAARRRVRRRRCAIERERRASAVGGAADFLDGLNSEPQFPTMLDGAAGAQ